MKNLNKIFILVFLYVSVTSCKKDEEVSTGNSANTSSLSGAHLKFNLELDGQAYSAEDGLNGYGNYSFSFDHDTANFVRWTNLSIFYTGDTNGVLLEIMMSKLKPLSEYMEMDDFRQFFYPGNHNFSSDTDSGIVIAFEINQTESYSSANASDQAGSRFLITDTITETDILGPYFKFRALFNCKLKDLAGNQKTITNGMVICKFQPFH